MSKSRKQRQADQLGMPIGTARSKLQRNILWHTLLRHGENVCAWCGDYIARPEDLAITHSQQWLDADPDLFWDHNNVAFMHPECAAEHGDAARRRKEASEVNIVNTRILDEHGNMLPGVLHDGKIYVAGNHGDRYQVQVQNNTSERVEIVVSVDGRDVIKGEPGSVETRGYIIGPRETYTIEGWRTSDDTVAAFRFGADKNNAYSTQMGTGAHLGVIGVVAFQELRRGILRSQGISPMGGGSWSSGGSGTFGSSGISGQSIDFSNDTTFSADVSAQTRGATMDSFEITPASSPTSSARRSPATLRSKRDYTSVQRKGSKAPRKEVKLGTKFGEERRSKVGHTTFTRRTTTPAQTALFEYDTKANLKRRGIPIDRAFNPPAPSAFPADDNGYCKPPKRR